MTRFSAIVPVFNRPEEVDELLRSMTGQILKFDEVIIVEDGSSLTCRDVVDSYKAFLPIQYFKKPNSGQGFTRNYGFEKATGDYLIVFDSDCILPDTYLENVLDGINQDSLDAFGGPDKAMPGFTPIQKAISYSMTSAFTTGGIRGKKNGIGKFHPRSFNMGISRKVFEDTGGYIITRMGEDIEFSIRIIEKGFKVGLIEDAYVFHKRRTSFWQFFKQLRFFGRARINVGRYFPGEIKLIHTLPALFLIGLIIWLTTPLYFNEMFVFGLWSNVAFAMLLFIDASRETKSLAVGFLSVIASYIQLIAYGTGFLSEGIIKLIKG